MILIDTGPLVALHDHEDSYHLACTNLFAELADQPTATTWACFAEAMYLLGQGGGFHFQARIWDSRSTSLLELVDLSAAEADYAEELMRKYQDLPMDLADATLVAVTDTRGWRRVTTLDHHFFTYRLRDGSVLDLVVPGRK